MAASVQIACMQASPENGEVHRGIWANPAVRAALKRDWADPNVRTTEIAEKLGITRGAVMGKADRMGLGHKAVPEHWVQPEDRAKNVVRLEPPSPRAAPEKPAKNSREAVPEHPWRGQESKPPKDPRSFETQMAVETKPLLMRDFVGIVGGERCECRWPLPGQADRDGWMEETLFCGAPCAPRVLKPDELSPYCLAHRDLSINWSGMKKVQKPAKMNRDKLKSTRRTGAVFDRGHVGTA